MTHEPWQCKIELNCIARGVPVDVWENVIPKDKTWSDLPFIAERCLRAYWPERDGELSPITEPSELNPIPDEVLIKARDGRLVCRHTIVDEINARYRARYI